MKNILIIGFGPHARRIYFPILNQWGKEWGAKLVFGVDLKSQKETIETYLQAQKSKLPFFYIDEDEKLYDGLHPNVEKRLNKIVDEYSIDGVVISTEPLVHMPYAIWALKKDLHILMDKPISTKFNVSTDLSKAQELKTDYDQLAKLYFDKRRKNKTLSFTLMAQRRYHPAFNKIKELINEVKLKTNCPVTSLQSFHTDGQWRFPTEIVEQIYHSYCQGYGKCSHSGYHTIDIIPWLIEAGETEEKHFDNVDIFTNFLRPLDFLKQFNLNDYRKMFKDFDKYNKYSEAEYESLMGDYGEIDAFCSFSFKSQEKILTLASDNLVHNGFAQRNWVTAEGRDLYKGNGRVRHESHYIEQGPFQAISFISYQGKEVDPENKVGIYDVSGEYHLDIHVFRNQKMFPEWKNYTKYSMQDLAENHLDGYSRGHQEDARRKCIQEFTEGMYGKTRERSNYSSSLEDHKKGVYITSGIYESAIRRRKNENPVVNIKF